MRVRGVLYACTAGRSSKYYFIRGNEDGSCQTFYGRISALRMGFSNEFHNPSMSVAAQESKKMKGWRRKCDDYVMIFDGMGEPEDLDNDALTWGRTGDAPKVARPEEPELEAAGPPLKGWFNNAK